MKTQSTGQTTVGRRSNNEDALILRPDLGVFIVADGMGGYEGGEVASQLTVETIESFFEQNYEDGEVTWPFKRERGLTLRENLVKVAVNAANRRVRRERQGPIREMGSTVVVLAVNGDSVVVGHIGDSRLYRLRQGTFQQLTRDHSLYEEFKAQGVDGLPADPRDFPNGHVITRAIGMSDQVDVDVQRLPAEEGDVFLLCTDGLSGDLDAAEISRLLELLPPEESCPQLIETAYAHGSRDNITAIVVKIAA